MVRSVYQCQQPLFAVECKSVATCDHMFMVYWRRFFSMFRLPHDKKKTWLAICRLHFGSFCYS